MLKKIPLIKDWLSMKKESIKKKIESVKKNKKCKKNDKENYEELYKRAMADFQNYKRRVEQERASWMFDAQIEVLVPILSVADDIDRAVEACEKQKDSEEKKAILDGLKIVQKNIEKTFKDLGVETIDCSGKFDPEFHEALLQVDSKEHESGDIVDVMNKGYKLNSKVLRHAKVSVAK